MTKDLPLTDDGDDDIEASLPTSRLLMSNSTTTTTLASNNYHSANNNNNNNNQKSNKLSDELDKKNHDDQVNKSIQNHHHHQNENIEGTNSNSNSRQNNFNNSNVNIEFSSSPRVIITNSTNNSSSNSLKSKFKKPKLKLGTIMMRKFNIINSNLSSNNNNLIDSKVVVDNKHGSRNNNINKNTYIKRYSENSLSNNNNNSTVLNGLVSTGIGIETTTAGPEEEEEKHDSNLIVCFKLFAIFSTIYFFMWSSSILSQAFNLTSYHYAGNFIRTSGFLQNPLIGLMVGVITTVIFQSSGAVTSVLVTIVGSGVLSVRQSIPIIMGANLGTSVTNTVVSLIVYRKKENFEIAMTAGIVHDMYNMMSVVFMLPIELLLHPLELASVGMLNLFGKQVHSSSSSSSSLMLASNETSTFSNQASKNGRYGNDGSDESDSLQFLSHLVKPLVDIVIMIDKDITNKLDPDVIVPSEVSLVKRCCNSERRGYNETICHEKCFSLFSHLDFSDSTVCLLLLVIAMLTLFTCLVFVVKVTKSLLGGKLLNWVAKLARKEYKYPYKLFVGYLFILVGMIITVILHSSGVFTSMLVPLAGGDVLNLMQIYELTLGSNVGTTTTGILAALSAQSKYPIETLQVALCHFLFNLAGILMFYTVPGTKLPIWASKRFGTLSAKNMWFSVGYLVVVFLVAPSLTMLIYFATLNDQ